MANLYGAQSHANREVPSQPRKYTDNSEKAKGMAQNGSSSNSRPVLSSVNMIPLGTRKRPSQPPAPSLWESTHGEICDYAIQSLCEIMDDDTDERRKMEEFRELAKQSFYDPLPTKVADEDRPSPVPHSPIWIDGSEVDYMDINRSFKRKASNRLERPPSKSSKILPSVEEKQEGERGGHRYDLDMRGSHCKTPTPIRIIKRESVMTDIYGASPILQPTQIQVLKVDVPTAMQMQFKGERTMPTMAQSPFLNKPSQVPPDSRHISPYLVMPEAKIKTPPAGQAHLSSVGAKPGTRDNIVAHNLQKMELEIEEMRKKINEAELRRKISQTKTASTGERHSSFSTFKKEAKGGNMADSLRTCLLPPDNSTAFRPVESISSSARTTEKIANGTKPEPKPILPPQKPVVVRTQHTTKERDIEQHQQSSVEKKPSQSVNSDSQTARRPSVASDSEVMQKAVPTQTKSSLNSKSKINEMPGRSSSYDKVSRRPHSRTPRPKAPIRASTISSFTSQDDIPTEDEQQKAVTKILRSSSVHKLQRPSPVIMSNLPLIPIIQASAPSAMQNKNRAVLASTSNGLQDPYSLFEDDEVAKEAAKRLLNKKREESVIIRTPPSSHGSGSVFNPVNLIDWDDEKARMRQNPRAKSMTTPPRSAARRSPENRAKSKKTQVVLEIEESSFEDDEDMIPKKQVNNGDESETEKGSESESESSDEEEVKGKSAMAAKSAQTPAFAHDNLDDDNDDSNDFGCWQDDSSDENDTTSRPDLRLLSSPPRTMRTPSQPVSNHSVPRIFQLPGSTPSIGKTISERSTGYKISSAHTVTGSSSNARITRLPHLPKAVTQLPRINAQSSRSQPSNTSAQRHAGGSNPSVSVQRPVIPARHPPATRPPPARCASVAHPYFTEAVTVDGKRAADGFVSYKAFKKYDNQLPSRMPASRQVTTFRKHIRHILDCRFHAEESPGLFRAAWILMNNQGFSPASSQGHPNGNRSASVIRRSENEEIGLSSAYQSHADRRDSNLNDYTRGGIRELRRMQGKLNRRTRLLRKKGANGNTAPGRNRDNRRHVIESSDDNDSDDTEQTAEEASESSEEGEDSDSEREEGEEDE